MDVLDKFGDDIKWIMKENCITDSRSDFEDVIALNIIERIREEEKNFIHLRAIYLKGLETCRADEETLNQELGLAYVSGKTISSDLKVKFANMNGLRLLTDKNFKSCTFNIDKLFRVVISILIDDYRIDICSTLDKLKNYKDEV